MWKLFEEGKVALVTGGARGIGRAIALELGREGVNVVVNYAKKDEAALKTCEEIKSYGVKAIAVKADVRSPLAVDEMFKDIKSEMGRLDLLVNNAGVIADAYMLTMGEEKFRTVLETNLFGVFNVTKRALMFMCSKRQNGGSIVNIASTTGISGHPGQANYAASKGGVIAFSKVIAKEYADKGVRCNVVAPGFVETDMIAMVMQRLKEQFLDLIPLKRFGDASEIANAVAFLLSSKASYITGKVLTADGGLING
ncbi:MAG: 3-oxoacyl-ACP reductase FabG [Clostridiales bacterium]|jgi:3-oxoacyl-[acyl-carrier protein] reductase|nr:3-oxoacyl-ACP reductase FabG [Clostridiales bacterium]